MCTSDIFISDESMLIKGFRKYTMNPALGLLPIGTFIFLNANSVDLIVSISISAFLSLFLDYLFHHVLKTIIFWLITIISIVPLALTCLFALFSPIRITIAHNYMIICEIWLVLTLFLMRSTKKYIVNRYFRRIDIQERNLLHETFSTIALAEHAFTLHLFIVLAYSFLVQSYSFEGWDFAVYAFLPVAIIALIICYKSYTLRSLSMRLFQEEWLPIVNEKGWAIGKIAKSISLQTKNKYLHPVIRIALICNDSIYLQKRPEDASFEAGYLDHPFEKYMLFKHAPNQSACNCMEKLLRGESLSYTFQFKYIFENKETKRLILFYVSKINNSEEIKNICMLSGKFWTLKQIEEEIPSHIFGECFLKEYEYLKTTVLNPALKEINREIEPTTTDNLVSCS